MRQHPRTQKVRLAHFDMSRAVFEIADREGLTFIEVTQGLTEAIALAAKYALRAERHPEKPDKPADEA